MNVGVLTFHDTANFGAALQAHATCIALAALGADPQIINYTNATRRQVYAPHARFLAQARAGHALAAAKTLAAMPLILARNRQFADFYRNHLPVGNTPFRSAQALRAAPPACDRYLAGSDQIWNYRNNGRDFTYMLDFVPDADRTASYASSFGLESIPRELTADYARTLARIRALSVREQAGARLVHALTGRRVPVVLDPVFLPDCNHWLTLADPQPRIPPPFILLYTSHPRFWKQLRAVPGFNRNGHHVAQLGADLSLSSFLNRRITVCGTAGPTRFLSLVRDALLVVTSSYHGTAFAILMQRPFVACLSGDPGRDARLVELLDTLALSHRILRPGMTAEEIERPVDWVLVQTRLAARRADSLHFLREALDVREERQPPT